MREIWTRAHDARIAEKCEGLLVIGPFHDDYFWRVGGPEEETICDRPVCEYNKNIVDVIRAVATWQNEMPDHRGFWIGIDSCHDAGPEAEVRDSSVIPGKRIWKQGDTLAEALAWAAYGAVTA